MVKEIYLRTPDDPNFVEGVLDYSNELESVLSQIRMVLGTQQGEVLGSYHFGADLEYYVFNTKENAKDLKKKIDEQINMFVHTSTNLSISTEVSFGNSGHGYDYGVVDIYINGIKCIGFLVNEDK